MIEDHYTMKLETRKNPKTHKVESVRLPFTPSQWVGIINKEGEWLPMCCGNLSAARDIFVSALRENGWIGSSAMVDIVELVGTHDGFDVILKDKKKRKKAVSSGDPIALFFDIWDNVKDRLSQDMPIQTLDVNDWKDASRILEAGTMSLRFKLMFSPVSANDYSDPEAGRKASERDAFHTKLFKIQELKNLIPAVRTLYAELPKLAPGVLDGFAIADKKTGEIAESRAGLAIYQTKSDAEEVLSIWSKQTKARENTLRIRPVRVSIEKGVEFKTR